MAHSVKKLSVLGRLVAAGKGKKISVLLDEYVKNLMAAVNQPATVKTHTNVLQHIAGYFKKVLPPEEKRKLAEIILAYRKGFLSREKVLAPLRSLARKYREIYLLQQTYFFPESGLVKEGP